MGRKVHVTRPQTVASWPFNVKYTERWPVLIQENEPVTEYTNRDFSRSAMSQGFRVFKSMPTISSLDFEWWKAMDLNPPNITDQRVSSRRDLGKVSGCILQPL